MGQSLRLYYLAHLIQCISIDQCCTISAMKKQNLKGNNIDPWRMLAESKLGGFCSSKTTWFRPSLYAHRQRVQPIFHKKFYYFCPNNPLKLCDVTKYSSENALIVTRRKIHTIWYTGYLRTRSEPVIRYVAGKVPGYQITNFRAAIDFNDFVARLLIVLLPFSRLRCRTHKWYFSSPNSTERCAPLVHLKFDLYNFHHLMKLINSLVRTQVHIVLDGCLELVACTDRWKWILARIKKSAISTERVFWRRRQWIIGRGRFRSCHLPSMTMMKMF